MFNNNYLIEIRKNKELPTPPQMVAALFDKELSEKDKLWLLFEDEIIIGKKELELVPFEHNLSNILYISNNIMNYQIIKTLYNQDDYNPFEDKINLEWFNSPQQQYLKNCFNTLLEIKEAKDNILVGFNDDKPFIMSEFNSKDINIKDLMFFYDIDVLLTYEYNDSVSKIYFNPETLDVLTIYAFFKKILLTYKTLCKVNPESVSIEINKFDLRTVDIFNLLNQLDVDNFLEEINEVLQEIKPTTNSKIIPFKKSFKGGLKKWRLIG